MLLKVTGDFWRKGLIPKLVGDGRRTAPEHGAGLGYMREQYSWPFPWDPGLVLLLWARDISQCQTMGSHPAISMQSL